MQLQLFLKGQQSYGFTEKRGKQWLGAWLGCIGLDRVFLRFQSLQSTLERSQCSGAGDRDLAINYIPSFIDYPFSF